VTIAKAKEGRNVKKAIVMPFHVKLLSEDHKNSTYIGSDVTDMPDFDLSLPESTL
jgi:hypothetical protein